MPSVNHDSFTSSFSIISCMTAGARTSNARSDKSSESNTLCPLLQSVLKSTLPAVSIVSPAFFHFSLRVPYLK